MKVKSLGPPAETPFTKSLKVTRASFHPKETASNYFTIKKKKENDAKSSKDTLVNIRLDKESKVSYVRLDTSQSVSDNDDEFAPSTKLVMKQS